MATVRVTIDGRPGSFADGTTILAAARQLGIEIPTLCDDPRLEPSGACRLCLVEVAGAAKPLAACAAPVADGMEIRTTSALLEAERRAVLEMLALRLSRRSHPRGSRQAIPPLPAGSRHHRGRAVRAGGDRGRVSSLSSRRHVALHRLLSLRAHLRRSSGTGCVASLGPRRRDRRAPGRAVAARKSVRGVRGLRGHLSDGSARGPEHPPPRSRPTTWTRTVCPYCGVGCELDYGTRDGRIVATRPVARRARQPRPRVREGPLRVRLRRSPRIASSRRGSATHADGGTRRGRDAIEAAAERLRRVIARARTGRRGRARIGAGDERRELPDTEIRARLAIGTNNVDCCARVCHAPSAAALKAMLGTGAATNSFDDIDLARTILVAGANPTENHPVVGARIRQAGAPRRTADRDRSAAHRARGRSGSDPSRAAARHEHPAAQRARARHRDRRACATRRSSPSGSAGLAEFRAFIAGLACRNAPALICGVPAEDIRRAARLYATGRPSMIVHGLGITEHQQGTDGVSGLVNLALLTGNLGRPGAGVNPLRGQNNVQGVSPDGMRPGDPHRWRLDRGRARGIRSGLGRAAAAARRA